MTRARLPRTRRPGFTLIELLVVILIILTLASLLLAAVFRATTFGDQVRTRNDISQLSVGLEGFKSKYDVYPPSRFILCENLDEYFDNSAAPHPKTNQTPASALHGDSVQIITTLWPRVIREATIPDPMNPMNFLKIRYWGNENPPLYDGFIDWNGNGVKDAQVLLEGDQCLVFFLGGIQDYGAVPGCVGFSTNPTRPDQVATGDRIPPFFDFRTNRLVNLLPNGNPIHPGSPYYSYLDAYGAGGSKQITTGAPYAYFSSNKTADNYNRFFSPPAVINSDCSVLGVWPYAQVWNPTSRRYLNPSSFQIVSAGRDGRFGSGTALVYDPMTGTTTAVSTWTQSTAGDGAGYSSGGPGFDDMSNFHDRLLGIPSGQ